MYHPMDQVAQSYAEDPMKLLAGTAFWVVVVILLPVLALADGSRWAKTIGFDIDLIAWYCREFLTALSRFMPW